MGLLNSAGECVRLSLLVLLFADPPYPAGVIVIVIVVVWTPPNNWFSIAELSWRRFSLHNDNYKSFHVFLGILILSCFLNIFFAKRRLRQRIDDGFHDFSWFSRNYNICHVFWTFCWRKGACGKEYMTCSWLFMIF